MGVYGSMRHARDTRGSRVYIANFERWGRRLVSAHTATACYGSSATTLPPCFVSRHRLLFRFRLPLVSAKLRTLNLPANAKPPASPIVPIGLRAAVSGASELKRQLCLNELVKRAITCSDVSPTPSNTLLFFSVYTEGTYHKLYAHYTYIEDGVRKFIQTLLEIYNAMLLKSVVDIVVAVDNMLR